MFLEKVFEKLIYKQLLKHVNDKKILIQNQSGFRHGHSCETSLQLVISQWKEWLDQKGNTIVAVFVDFCRAFETINRDILVDKLRGMGLSMLAIKWFKSYLTNRVQVTKVDEYVSSETKCDNGVPQGTVLGALLFILYINDIEDIARIGDEDVFLKLFADDTLIAIKDTDITRAVERINNVLQELNLWLSKNSLVVNARKTKVMILGSEASNAQPVVLGNETIEVVDTTKYLGVLIDNKMNFRNHALTVITKLSKKINYFRRVSQNLNLQSRLTVFKSIIAPHMQYCPTILFYLDSTYIQDIQKLQNKGMRSILKCDRYTPIKEMLEALNFMSVYQYLMYQTLCFIYKLCNGLMPEYLSRGLNHACDIHDHLTRNRKNLYIRTVKKENTKRSIYHDGLDMYNSLPNAMKDGNLRHFKTNAMLYVKNRSIV